MAGSGGARRGLLTFLALLILFATTSSFSFSTPASTLKLKSHATKLPVLSQRTGPSFEPWGRSKLQASSTKDVQSTGEPTKQFFLKTLWDFTRPHTLIGSALCIPAIHLYAAPLSTNPSIVRLIHSIIFATLPSLLMNLYITGLNQITDVEIDKISKPFLPIPAGRLSKAAATIVVLVSLVAGIALGWADPVFCTPALRATLLGSALLGTLYSVPPFRLKRFPLLAALCIIVVRGTLINVGFFAHARAATYKGAAAAVPPLLALPFRDLRCGLLTAYFAVFGVVIALMKDVPDAQGDRANDIRSFTVRFGQARMFQVGRRLMTALVWATGGGFLAGAAQAAGLGPSGGGAPLALGGAAVAARRAALGALALGVGQWVRREAAAVDPEEPRQVYKFYMFLWKLFYGSYFVLPFVQ